MAIKYPSSSDTLPPSAYELSCSTGVTFHVLEPSARPRELGAQNRQAEGDRDNAGPGKQKHGGARRQHRETHNNLHDPFGLSQRRNPHSQPGFHAAISVSAARDGQVIHAVRTLCAIDASNLIA